MTNIHPIKPERLRPYQVTDIAFMQEHKRVLNANDMGLGKTVEAILAAAIFIDPDHPLLVISSMGQKWFWQDEFLNWTTLEEDDIQIITGPKLTKGKSVYIIHWDIVHRYGGLKDVKWGALIVDEAHKQKNRKTKRTKSIWTLARSIPVVYLLTGTPIVNRPDDLWALLKTLYPKQYTSYWRFFHEYTHSRQNPWGGYEIMGVANVEDLIKELGDRAFRRLKKDHLDELPDKQQMRVNIALSALEMKAYGEMKDYMITQIEDAEVKSPTLMGQEMKMREFCVGVRNPNTDEYIASTKMDWTMETLLQRHEAGSKTVVASMRRAPIAEMERRLTKAKINYRVMHGDVAAVDRNIVVEAFQTDPSIEVFLMTVQTGGEGWTLTAADMLIFLDRPWTMKDVRQTEDRLHRLTQRNPVTIVTLLALGTIEENVERILGQKERIIEEVMGRLSELL